MSFANATPSYVSIASSYNKTTKKVTYSSTDFGVRWVLGTLPTVCGGAGEDRRGYYAVGHSSSRYFNNTSGDFPQMTFVLWDNYYEETIHTQDNEVTAVVDAYDYNDYCRGKEIVARAVDYYYSSPTFPSSTSHPYALYVTGNFSVWCGSVSLYGVVEVTHNAVSQPPLAPLTPTYTKTNICYDGVPTPEFTITNNISEPYRVDEWNLYRSTTSGGTYSLVGTFNATGGTSFVDTGATGCTYWYYIQAANELYSANTTVFEHKITTPAVTDLQAATIEDNFPVLNFTASTETLDCVDLWLWYLNGELTGTTTGNTFTGILPQPNVDYTLTVTTSGSTTCEESQISNAVVLNFNVEIPEPPVITGITFSCLSGLELQWEDPNEFKDQYQLGIRTIDYDTRDGLPSGYTRHYNFNETGTYCIDDKSSYNLTMAAPANRSASGLTSNDIYCPVGTGNKSAYRTDVLGLVNNTATTLRFTFSMWFKYGLNANEDGSLASIFTTYDGTYQNNGITAFHNKTTNVLYVRMYGKAWLYLSEYEYGYKEWRYNVDLQDNTWYNLIFTIVDYGIYGSKIYDGLWVDGKPQAATGSTIVGATFMTTLGNVFRLAAHNGSSYSNNDQHFDELTVWNRALTAEEMLEMQKYNRYEEVLDIGSGDTYQLQTINNEITYYGIRGMVTDEQTVSPFSNEVSTEGVFTGHSFTIETNNQCCTLWNTAEVQPPSTDCDWEYVLLSGATQTGTFTEVDRSTGTTLTHTGITYGQTYWYKVNAESAYFLISTRAQSLLSAPEMPLAPQLSGEIIVTGFTLNWIDPNVNNCEYEIYKAQNLNFPLSGVTSYWKFDETSGTVAEDSIGIYDGTIQAAGLSPCKINNGYKINSGYASTRAIMPRAAFNFEHNETFSLNIWLYINSNGYLAPGDFFSNYGYEVIETGNNTGNGFRVYSRSWDTNINYVTIQMFQTVDGASKGQISYVSPKTLYSGKTWNMITITYDGSSDGSGLNFYHNGSYIGTGSGSMLSDATIKNDYDFCIGGTPASPAQSALNSTYYFLDEAGIWDRALSSDEVSTLYNSGNGMSVGGLELIATVTGNTYTDTDFSAGNAYTYYVRGLIDCWGTQIYSPFSNELTVVGGDILNAPSGLTATGLTYNSGTLNWVNNNTSGVTGNYVYQIINGEYVLIADVSSGTTSLALTGLTENDYVCYAVSAYRTLSGTTYESRSTDFCFYVPDLTLPVVEILSIDGISYFSASGSSVLIDDGGDPDCIAGICWDTLPSPTTGDTYTTDITGEGNFISYMSGLTDNTTYYVRAWALNVSGITYSNELSFTTLQAFVPDVLTLRVSGMTFNLASGVGQVTDNNGSTVTEYGLCWNSKGNPDINDSIVSLSGETFDEYLMTMGNLVPNTRYYVRAFATNVKGTGYGRVLSFETTGQKSSTYIRFEDNVLYDLVVDDFEVNFSLTDIKNLSEAKSSYTLPIKIPYTPETTKIFGNLFNVNNATTITDVRIPAKLIHDNKVIINGYAYVDTDDFQYIKLIIARTDLNIFEVTKNLTLSQLDFTDVTYYNKEMYNVKSADGEEGYLYDARQFTFTGDTGSTHHFVKIDWTGKVYKTAEYFTNFTNLFLSELPSYNLSPVIRVKTIFDKIFETHGFTYNASQEFLDKLDGMYMTTNVNSNKYTCVGESYYVFLGTFTSGNNTFLYPRDYAGITKAYNKFAKKATVGGSISPFLLDGVEQTITINFTAKSTSFDKTLKFYMHPSFSNIDLDDDNEHEFLLAEYTFESTQTSYVPIELNFKFTPDVNQVFNYTNSQYLFRIEKDPEITIQSNYVTMKTECPNWLYYTGNTYTLTDLLSESYTQFNLLNDLFNMFNIYVYADDVNNKKLNLLTHNDYYLNDVLDWTKKFSVEKLQKNDTSKELYEKYVFTNTLGGDSINKGFSEIFLKGLNQKIVFNNNELSIKANSEIKTTSINPIFTNSQISVSSLGNVYDYETQTIMTTDSGENGAIIYGYLNKIRTGKWVISYNDTADDSPAKFYMARPISTSAIYNLTLSPYRILVDNTTEISNKAYQRVSSGDTFALLYDSQETFLYELTGDTITNNNLYTNFYANDIESKLFTQQKFLKTYIDLNVTDLKIENFRKRIWIENQKLGDAYYRLNKIVYNSDENTLAYVELVTDSAYQSNYSGETKPIIYNYDANNKLPYVIRDTTITGQTGQTGQTGATQVFFSPVITSEIVSMNSENLKFGETLAVTIYYEVWADCDSMIVPPEQTSNTAYIEYTTNGGSSWSYLDTASAENIPPDDSGYDMVTGTTTISGVTALSDIRFTGSWGYSSGINAQNGGYKIIITGVTTDNAEGAEVICDDTVEAYGTTSAALSCSS